MSDHDDELERWADDFRGADIGRAPLPSAAEIVAQSERDARKRVLEWAAQIAGTAFAALVFTGLVTWKRSVLLAVLAGIVLPVLFALFGVFVFSRVSAGRAMASSVNEHVALAVRHRRASHRIARASVVALAILVLAFWAWLPFFILSHGDRFAAQPWRLFVAIGAATAVFALGFFRVVRTAKKARADLERWRAIETSLTASE